MITSIYYDQNKLLKALLELYNLERFDLDPCYSKGNFYKEIPRPKFCSDIDPKFSFIDKADASKLKFPFDSLKSIMFDPPFLATKGPSLKKKNGSNLILQRFSVFPTEKELFRFYFECLSRFYLFLKPKGYLFVKCQDKVSSGKQYFSHIYLHNMAIEIGFYPKDLFILVNKSKMIGHWGDAAQQHARKYHSYFFVFQKTKPKVNLVNLLEV